MMNIVSFDIDLDQLVRSGSATATLKVAPLTSKLGLGQEELPLTAPAPTASNDNIVTTEEPVKKVRAPSLNRKPSVRMTKEMAATAKFLLSKGKEKEEVAEFIGTSVSSVSRVIEGNYNEKFGL